MDREVHVGQFYFCSEVKEPVELCYIVELSKYLNTKGYVLSLDGIIFGDDVKASRFWGYLRYALEEGWVTAVECDAEIDYTIKVRNIMCVEEVVELDIDDTNRRTDVVYDYRTPQCSEVTVNRVSEMAWEWVYASLPSDKCLANHKTLVARDTDIGWVSFVAYIAVQRYVLDKPVTFTIYLNNEVVSVVGNLSALFVLLECTSCCRDWVQLNTDSISDKRMADLGYIAWYWRGKEKGKLRNWYSVKDKLSYMEELGIGVGDVVGVYERYVKQKADTMKYITSFRVGVVQEVTEKGIKLMLLNTKKTKAQGLVDYENYTMATKHMYGFKNPYENINTTTKFYEWMDIGVEYVMWNEKYFITPLSDDGMNETYVWDDKGKPVKKVLTSNDLTYYILKDYSVDFNEEHFLEMYFGGRTPAYAMRG